MRPSLSRLQARHWALVGAAAVVAAAAGRPGVGGILLGGGVIGLAVPVYAVALRALLEQRNPRLAIVLLSVKLLVLLGLGWLAFSGGPQGPDPIGFVIGVGCLPVAAVWEALRARGD